MVEESVFSIPAAAATSSLKICKERPLHSPPGHAGPKHDANQFVTGVRW